MPLFSVFYIIKLALLAFYLQPDVGECTSSPTTTQQRYILPNGEILPPGAIPLPINTSTGYNLPNNGTQTSTSSNVHLANGETLPPGAVLYQPQNSSVQAPPTIPPPTPSSEVDMKENPSFMNTGNVDLSSPTQVMDINGNNNQTSETSDFVVPTRVILPHVVQPEYPSIQYPIQQKTLSPTTFKNQPIEPFNPEPEPYTIPKDAPFCPVHSTHKNAEIENFDDLNEKKHSENRRNDQNKKKNDADQEDESSTDNNDSQDTPQDDPENNDENNTTDNTTASSDETNNQDQENAKDSSTPDQKDNSDSNTEQPKKPKKKKKNKK